MIRREPRRARVIWTLLYLLSLMPLALYANGAGAQPAPWDRLKAGTAVLVLRHALAPGVGDPPHFTLGDCSTQRNLNEEGREQARQWRLLLRRQGIEQPRVYTSQWCRTRETAAALDNASAEDLPSLNSFFRDRDGAEQQTQATREFINDLPSGTPIILVTHQVNISALAGVYAQSNEGIFLALPLTGQPQVLGRLIP